MFMARSKVRFVMCEAASYLAVTRMSYVIGTFRHVKQPSRFLKLQKRPMSAFVVYNK